MEKSECNKTPCVQQSFSTGRRFCDIWLGEVIIGQSYFSSKRKHNEMMKWGVSTGHWETGRINNVWSFERLIILGERLQNCTKNSTSSMGAKHNRKKMDVAGKIPFSHNPMVDAAIVVDGWLNVEFQRTLKFNLAIRGLTSCLLLL